MEQRIRAALERLAADPYHPGAALSAHGRAGEVHLGAGTIGPDTPVFFASTTKLAVTVILRMIEAEGLSLDTPVLAVLPGVWRLWVQDSLDLTDQITLRHLMAHVSGLPDYLGSATPKKGLMADLLAGRDRSWTLDQALERARALGPVGLPGQMDRAHYSDTNYQLLGAVIEAVDGVPLARAMERRLFAPLGLRQTWLYEDAADRRPMPLRYRAEALDIPQAMVSFRGDGALVSTTREGLALVQAIFAGRFCDPARLMEPPFRTLFFPLTYGTGVMRFALPRWMTLFRKYPAFYGHSGLSGALLFHAPEAGLSVAATVNQIDRPGTVFKLILKAA